MLAGGLNMALACLNHAEYITDTTRALPYDIYIYIYICGIMCGFENQ